MIRVGSRDSQLALKQAKQLISTLTLFDRDEFEIVPIKSAGDKNITDRFEKIGTKGIFTKELDLALIEERIDIAIHSLKDLPSKMIDGIMLAGISPCSDQRDAWVSHHYNTLQDLPKNAKVGTSSARRVAQIKQTRPDLEICPIRGNLQTRFLKMEKEKMDGMVLAAAGLIRMGLQDQIQSYLDPQNHVPAIGQGYLAITAKKKHPWLSNWQDSKVWDEAISLRHLMEKLGGGCSVPLGACWIQDKDQRFCHIYISDREGTEVYREKQAWIKSDMHTIEILFDQVKRSGAISILEKVKHG